MSPVCAEMEPTVATTPFKLSPEISETHATGFALLPIGTAFDYEIRKRLRDYPLEDGEQAPSADAIDRATKIVADAANSSGVEMPDVGAFFGEVQLSWNNDNKQLTLLSRDTTLPRLHFYEWEDDAQSHHRATDNVTANDLLSALRWLHE